MLCRRLYEFNNILDHSRCVLPRRITAENNETENCEKITSCFHSVSNVQR
jgi:hypothetical protein